MGHQIHEKHLDCTNWHQTQDTFVFAPVHEPCSCEDNAPRDERGGRRDGRGGDTISHQPKSKRNLPYSI